MVCKLFLNKAFKNNNNPLKLKKDVSLDYLYFWSQQHGAVDTGDKWRQLVLF